MLVDGNALNIATGEGDSYRLLWK